MPRKHTPIVSVAQRGLFGSELARRRAGKARRMKGITTAELERHLRESRGKRLSGMSTHPIEHKRVRKEIRVKY